MNPPIVNVQKISLISSLWAISIFLNVAQATAQTRYSLVFECRLNPQTKINSTFIVYSDGVTSELIRWKSKLSRNPRKTCQNASDRFQEFWSNGSLNHLKINNRMVCGVASRSTPCDESTKLFELLSSSNPKTTVTTLLNKINIRDNNTEPIVESSESEIVIDFKEVVKQLHSRQ